MGIKVIRIFTLENSKMVLKHTHSKTKCAGTACTLHNRTDHHMRSWPQHWNGYSWAMERLCKHGIGHPDPDEINKDFIVIKLHKDNCDGCCVQNG